MRHTRQPIAASHEITIRPISSNDAEKGTRFFKRLSPQTKHYRFLAGVRELLPDEVKRFCGVDGEQTMAFIAVARDDQGEETQIGVSRYAPDAEENVRELAVTVADEWQGRGLDVLLTNQLIDYAKSHGVKRLYSIELADNDSMRSLARNIGMTERRDPADARQVIYSLSLS